MQVCYCRLDQSRIPIAGPFKMAQASSHESLQDIFLSCRSVFTGQNAQVRRPKKVRELLQQHESSIRPLMNRYPLDTVADIARNLLERRVFESNMWAKIEFPELYEASASRGAQRTASEIEAARSEAEALAEAEPTPGETVDGRVLENSIPEEGWWPSSFCFFPRPSSVCLSPGRNRSY